MPNEKILEETQVEEMSDLLEAVPPVETDKPDPEGQSDEVVEQPDTTKPEVAEAKVEAASTPAPETTPESTDKPALIAGKFKTVEDLERSYKELESAFGQSQTARQRQEKLLEQLVIKSASEEDKPVVAAKTRDIIKLISKAALEDEDVDDMSVVSALVAAIKPILLQDPDIGRAMQETVLGMRTYEEAKSKTLDGFYEANPELKDVPKRAMEFIAQEEQARIALEYANVQVTPDVAAEYTSRVLNATADRAREIFNRTKTTPGSVTSTKPKVKAQPSGTKSEGAGGGRPPAKMERTDQQKEMDELLL